MSVCLYPGSFDPVTNGHMDIIRRAARLFDTLYVGVLYNPDKHGLFSPEERAEMLKEACSDIGNVKCVLWDGLTAALCRELHADAIVRGVRGTADLEYEKSMAALNKMLLPGLDTVFFPANAAFEHISSSYVKQIASFGGDITEMVPECVKAPVTNKYKNIKGGKKDV